MAISQTELKTALQALLNTVKFRIRNRYGLASQLDLASMKAGEIAMATDTQEVYACFGNGIFRNLARGITIKGVYVDLTALQTAHPAGAESDIYAAGSAPQHLYIWQNSAWTDMGAWNDITMYATAGGLATTNTSLAATNTVIGALANLTTTVKTSIVNAINSLVTRIAALESLLTVTTTTVSYASPATSGSAVLRKCGKTVTCQISITKSGGFLTTEETVSAQIPTGWRPTQPLVFIGNVTNDSSNGVAYKAMRFAISTDGYIKTIAYAANGILATGLASWTVD